MEVIMIDSIDSIKGIGCDVVSVLRIAKMLDNNGFLDKVFTEYEKKYISGKGAKTAAGIWAAKEAVSKAFGTGFVGFNIPDIEVRHNKEGAPQIVLYNRAKAKSETIGVKKVHISISHEEEQALAFAVLE